MKSGEDIATDYIEDNIDKNASNNRDKNSNGQIKWRTLKNTFTDTKKSKENFDLQISNKNEQDEQGEKVLQDTLKRSYKRPRNKYGINTLRALRVTGKSLSEALIIGSTNPQYDKRLFIDLPVQYMKTTSSEHWENMLCTQIVFCFCSDIQNNLCTQHVFPMF